MNEKRRISLNTLPILLGAAGAVYIVIHWVSAIEGLGRVTANPAGYSGKPVIVCGQLVRGAGGALTLEGGRFPLIIDIPGADKVPSGPCCVGGTLKPADKRARITSGDLIVRPKIYSGWRANMIEWISGFRPEPSNGSGPR